MNTNVNTNDKTYENVIAFIAENLAFEKERAAAARETYEDIKDLDCYTEKTKKQTLYFAEEAEAKVRAYAKILNEFEF